MAWTTPVAGIADTVITAAWSTANVVNPLNWLRAMTGNADPPGSNYVAVSTSTTATSWQKVGADVLADGAVTNDKLALGAVGVNQMANGAVHAEKLGVIDSPADNEVLTYDSTTGDLEWQAASALVNGVPSGAVVWFETLAELTAAGAGWARYTAADGRLLIGAGTTFSQTFSTTSPGPNYGSTWAVAVPAHTHDLGADAGINLEHGGDTTVSLGAVTSVVSTGASSTTFLPPSRAGIWGRKS